MKNLRVLLAATLPLLWASTTVAQSAPIPGPYPSDPLIINNPVGVGPIGAPVVEMGDPLIPNAPRLWFRGGWAYQWVNDSPAPHPLLTTSDPLDQGLLIPGTTTQVLLGGPAGGFDYGGFHGVTFSLGGWSNPDRSFGFESNSLFSFENSVVRAFASDGTVNSQPLYRPFTDYLTDTPASVAVAEPFLQAGTFTVSSTMNFNNNDSNLLFNLYRDEARSLTGMFGYRFAYVREQLWMTQTSLFLQDNVGFFMGQPLPAFTSVTIRDRIETVNRIFAGQFGLKYERTAGRLTFTATANLGFGWSNQRIFYDGRTTLEPDIETAQGGVLLQRSLPDRNRLDQFIFIPDVGVQARARLVGRLHASVGYNFTWFSNVARPGDYIDSVIEPTQVPTQAGFINAPGVRPRFFERDEGMILHGATAAIMWIY